MEGVAGAVQTVCMLCLFRASVLCSASLLFHCLLCCLIRIYSCLACDEATESQNTAYRDKHIKGLNHEAGLGF